MADASIADRLDRLPIVRTHRRAVAVVGIGAFFDLFDIFLAGVLGTVLSTRFHLSPWMMPWMLGSAFLGMFVGAVSLGIWADRYGRRAAFLVNLGIYSAFTLLGALSVNAAMLVACRFVAGIGIGAELPLCDAYLSEILPVRHRGHYTAIAYTIGFLGVPAVGFLARLLVPTAPLGVDGWRWLFAAGSLGGAVVWVLRSALPESPRWLAGAGRTDEAEAIVSRLEEEARLEGSRVQVPGSTFENHEPGTSNLEPPSGIPFSQLFSGPYAGRTLMLWTFQIFQTVGYYGFGTLVPIVLVAKGFPVATSLTYTSLAFVGYPVGSALSLVVVERVDRKWLIVGSGLLMAALGLGLGYSASAGLILLLGFTYTLVSNIFSNAFHIFQAEIFPTAVRATAAGTAYGLSRLSSAAMPFVLLPVLNRHGAGAMFAVVGAAMLIVVLDIALFAPSTTGRALEDVSTAPVA